MLAMHAFFCSTSNFNQSVKKEGVTLEKTNETERQNEGGNVKSKTTDFRTKTLILSENLSYNSAQYCK